MSHLSPPLLAVSAVALLLSCDAQTTQPIENAAGSDPAPELRTAKLPDFDPHDFVRVVDNRYFPLQPGTRYIYRGVEDGEREVNIVDVTTDRKNILGISAVVVLDRVFVSGELTEKTFDWYAQDEDGNVWYLGEDTREFEDGRVVSTLGSWEAGKNGAKPGIIMLAHPKVGDAYRQEFLAGIAEDRARVVRRGLKVSVPYGTFHNCLKTVEFTALEPGIKEAKYYCPRVGFVKAQSIQGEIAHLVLTRIIRLRA
jgi:hypothetical protein